MYWNRRNKSSHSPLSKTRIILILSATLSSLILIDLYADRPIMDFHMALTSLETDSRFKLACSLMNRGMNIGTNVSFVLEVPQGLEIISGKQSAYFDSFPPLTRENLEWTIEAVEMGAFEIECSIYSETETMTKKLNVQVAYHMTIIIEKVKVIDDTDWLGPGEVYLIVKVDSTETRFPETGEVQMANGDIVDIFKVAYEEDVVEKPLLTIDIWERDPLDADSLGSINEYAAFNLNPNWFITDNGKAEVLISCSATIKVLI